MNTDFTRVLMSSLKYSMSTEVELRLLS